MSCPVMVVEDDPEIRDSLCELLEIEGFEVARAENGLDAMAQLKAGALPNIILLDLMMPVMDGWEFRRAQSSDPALSKIPVAVLSAAGAQQMADLDVPHVLHKPVDVGEVLSLLRRYVR